MKKPSWEIGMELAREFFAHRGNNTEVHVRETTLAALLTIAAMRARGVTTAGHPEASTIRKSIDRDGRMPIEFFDELLGQGRR